MTPHIAALLFLAGSLVYLGIRYYYQRQQRSREKETDRASLTDRLLVVAVGASQTVLPILAMCTPLLKGTHHEMPAWAAWLGVKLYVSGLWLFWKSHRDLGANWSLSLALDTQHQLVTRGVYQRIRHPMYAAFFLMAVAQALLIANWVGGLAALVAVSALYLARVPNEERMMAERFGEAYRAYMARSGGLLPRHGW